jgi:hypothetical protein
MVKDDELKQKAMAYVKVLSQNIPVGPRNSTKLLIQDRESLRAGNRIRPLRNKETMGLLTTTE